MRANALLGQCLLMSLPLKSFFLIRSNLLKITVWGRHEACCRCESPELRAPAAELLLSD